MALLLSNHYVSLGSNLIFLPEKGYQILLYCNHLRFASRRDSKLLLLQTPGEIMKYRHY